MFFYYKKYDYGGWKNEKNIKRSINDNSLFGIFRKLCCG